MSQTCEFMPLGFVHSDDYDDHEDGCDHEDGSVTSREKLIAFIDRELHSKHLDNDLELWTNDWTRRIEPQESGLFHRLELSWFGGKSREDGSHPDFPGIKYSCDVTAHPRPVEEPQPDSDRNQSEAEWANMCAGASAYPSIPLYRPEIVKGRLLTVSNQSSGSEWLRGPAPPWAVLIRRIALDRAWRIVRNEPVPLTGQTLPPANTAVDEDRTAAEPIIAREDMAPLSAIGKSKKRRPRKPEVAPLIEEGASLVKSGKETMNSAANMIAKREWSKYEGVTAHEKIAQSQEALAQQIRKGIAALEVTTPQLTNM